MLIDFTVCPTRACQGSASELASTLQEHSLFILVILHSFILHFVVRELLLGHQWPV